MEGSLLLLQSPAVSGVARAPRPSGGRALRAMLAAVILAAALAPAATAQIPLGAPGPDFTKTALGGSPVSLSQYAGKVVVLFLLGYS